MAEGLNGPVLSIVTGPCVHFRGHLLASGTMSALCAVMCCQGPALSTNPIL